MMIAAINAIRAAARSNSEKLESQGSTAKNSQASIYSLPLKAQGEQENPPSKERLPRFNQLKKVSLILLSLLLVPAAAIAGYQGISYLGSHEDTDDAYTTAHLHPVSTRINGTVNNVLVDDNEHVEKGQVLVLLDPRDYQVKVQQAQAALATARLQAEAAQSTINYATRNASGKKTEAQGDVSNSLAGIAKSQALVAEAQAAIPEAEATLAEKQAELTRSEMDYHRYEDLAAQGAVSYQQRDAATRDYKVAQQAVNAAMEAVKGARARFDQAQQAVLAARAQLTQSQGLVDEAKATGLQTAIDTRQYDVARSAIDEAQAALDDAQLQLSYTKIVAPESGRIGKKSVEAGQRVQPGQQLLEVVSDSVWIVANFKETQLQNMRAGQPVEVRIDTFSAHPFKGFVDSFSPGSGQTFSLLPPDNATGNFTKIVQRLPVKILLDPNSIKGYEDLLAPGMSVIASVKVH